MTAGQAAPAAEPLRIPAFWCPVRPEAHPEDRRLDAAALEWMHGHALEDDPAQLKRLAQADFGSLAAWTMPYGKLAPLQTATQLHAVLFALDDVLDEGTVTPRQLAPGIDRIRRLLEPGAEPGTDEPPHGLALREIRRALEPHATAAQLRRWVAGMDVYLSALVVEAGFRRQEGLPSLAEYVPMWMGAIGMAPSTALIPIVAGVEVPEADLDQPRVRALTEMTWTLVAWDNDLYSRAKEVERAGDTLNLVDVLAREHGWDPARAQREAVAMRDRVMALFLRLRDEVLAEAGPPLEAYLHGLSQFVRGHLDWASACVRYQETPDSAADAGWWKAGPADDSRTPLPIERIAWWWRLES